MCYLANQGIVVYHKRDNLQFLDTIFYSVSIPCIMVLMHIIGLK